MDAAKVVGQSAVNVAQDSVGDVVDTAKNVANEAKDVANNIVDSVKNTSNEQQDTANTNIKKDPMLS